MGSFWCQNYNFKEKGFFIANLSSAVKMQSIIVLTKHLSGLKYSTGLAVVNLVVVLFTDDLCWIDAIPSADELPVFVV